MWGCQNNDKCQWSKPCSPEVFLISGGTSRWSYFLNKNINIWTFFWNETKRTIIWTFEVYFQINLIIEVILRKVLKSLLWLCEGLLLSGIFFQSDDKCMSAESWHEAAGFICHPWWFKNAGAVMRNQIFLMEWPDTPSEKLVTSQWRHLLATCLFKNQKTAVPINQKTVQTADLLVSHW